MIDCSNTGTIEGASYTGGLVGYSTQGGALTDCSNAGTIEGASYTGGLVGYSTQGGDIRDCSNDGTVEGTTTVGGVVGLAYGVTVRNCVNTDTVISNKWTVATWNNDVIIGGVVGRAQYGSVVDSCSATTNAYVSAAGHYVGGVVGLADFETDVTSCTNHGTVYGVRGERIGGVVGRVYGAQPMFCVCCLTANSTPLPHPL